MDNLRLLASTYMISDSLVRLRSSVVYLPDIISLPILMFVYCEESTTDVFLDSLWKVRSVWKVLVTDIAPRDSRPIHLDSLQASHQQSVSLPVTESVIHFL